MDIVNELVSVINTLQTLEIKSTYDTMNKLLGCIQVLDNLASKLDKKQEDQKKDEPEIKIEEIGVCGK